MTFQEYVAKQKTMIAERHLGEVHLIIKGEYFKIAEAKKRNKGFFGKLANFRNYKCEQSRRAFY